MGKTKTALLSARAYHLIDGTRASISRSLGTLALLRVAKVSMSLLQSFREQRSVSTGKNCLTGQCFNDIGE